LSSSRGIVALPRVLPMLCHNRTGSRLASVACRVVARLARYELVGAGEPGLVLPLLRVLLTVLFVTA
jgi:hypothetical protein